ncbi:hypothetical protein HNY73_009683 [Argiope bruennichi]|uniref:Gustatory receptor n=1 Tax=Argiope bruennichi TaxID=94029 RepID=A0A8T0FFT7_ARGBR|nr:hypothetical protein HNY73_009683 [Argiope bruennichi]
MGVVVECIISVCGVVMVEVVAVWVMNVCGVGMVEVVGGMGNEYVWCWNGGGSGRYGVITIFVMNRRKQEFTNLLKMLQLICLKRRINKINAVVCSVLFLPFLFAFLMTLTHGLMKEKYLSKRFFYGFEFKSHIIMYSATFCKLFSLYLLYPTLTNLIAVAYSTSCYLCCGLLQQLYSEIEKCDPKALNYRVMTEMLKKRHQIISMLEMIETTLSTASFLVCIANFLACLSGLSLLLIYLTENTAMTIIQISFMSGSALLSTISIFLNAGQIPIEMERFSHLMRRRIEERFFLGLKSLYVPSDLPMADEKAFLLSGCDFIYYKKGTILSLLGTILTYGLLLLGIEFKHDFKK